ncbi:acyltransferase family protein [Butyrivibrio sp. JL13D10]|uniref:acyltransferase family protein n=1 Tax=Butyrivibrio sp. JL13D10 TaxID=3236815 RepID=UPI0038B45539
MTLELSKLQSTILKAVAIIFVIMSHTGTFPSGGAVGVHLFLIVSGYGIYCSLEKGSDNYWRKRIQSVYLPYLFSTVIFLIIRYYLWGNLSFTTVIISILGLDFNRNADPTMWYISYIFVCYLIAWIIFKLNKRPSLAILFGIFAFGVITLFGYKYIIWHRGTIVWNYGFSFPLGMLLAKYRLTDGHRAKYVKVGIAMFSLAITLILLPIPHEKFIKLFFTLAFAVFLYCLLTSLITNDKNFIVKFFKIIGKQSYFMYLNEAFIIRCIKTSSVVPFNTLISVVCSFMCAFVMHQIFQLFIKKCHC